ncbi:uncharacterized protein LOC132946181 [Metopolophium dirhodum]|uniref:uncharacterized protein LOC132941305 n=2 Tax=Metopolophium dirhodum TaxID=44670 RepID=UPI002990471E|nr:uncharacterized protein LOC132941305 [Metopolophium dirhodum]XP_060872025.1 uncharacterized protein LOC132946181 [Metopolophium dirhodum]
MAGSIGNMAALYKKKFIYVPPTPPSELIESANFTINFTERKFLHVGLNPTEKFDVSILIITPSRFVKISVDLLRRIFSLMGNILSFILDQPQKYKRNLFLETEIISMSSMVYQGENMLVIESKTQAGCRVLLSRTDLMKLQYLEWSINETVVRKSTIIRPLVLKQFETMGNYLDQEFTKVDSPPKTPEEMIVFINNLSDDKIIGSTPKEDMNFISQLKMYASSQLAEQWAQRWNGEMSPELFTESEMRLISPPRYSSMSPMHEDLSQARVADEERGIDEFLTQATWAPARKTKLLPIDDPGSLPASFDSDNFAQPPPWYTAPQYIESSPPSPAVDENDGPTSFNLSPSSPPALLGFTGQKLAKKKPSMRSVKRKLF